VMFAETFERFTDICREDALLFLVGSLDRSRDRPSLRIDEVTPLDKWAEKAALQLLIKLAPGRLTAESLGDLAKILKRYPGAVPVQFECRPDPDLPDRLLISGDHSWKVRPQAGLFNALERWGGRESIEVGVRPIRLAERRWGGGNRFAARTGNGRG